MVVLLGLPRERLAETGRVDPWPALNRELVEVAAEDLLLGLVGPVEWGDFTVEAEAGGLGVLMVRTLGPAGWAEQGLCR
jgi:hypothetical protein